MDNDIIMDVGTSLFLFYLLLSSNFLDTLYGCKTQQLFIQNMWFKHFVGILTFFASVVYISGNNKSPLHCVGTTVLFYMLFILTTRCDSKIFMVVLGCLFVGFVLQKIKNYYYKDTSNSDSETVTEEEIPVTEKKKMNQYITNIQKSIYIISIILTIIGSIIYLGEKKVEYKNKFSYVKFILGKSQCNFDTLEPLSKHNYFYYIKKAFA